MAEQTKAEKARAARTLAARRQTRAVMLRSMGWTFDAIAQALLPCDVHRTDGGWDSCTNCLPMYAHRSSAKRAVETALAQEYREGDETREQMRRHTLAQLDLLLTRMMPDALGGDAAAGRVALRAIQQRAQLLGLNAPTRHVIQSELDAELEELMVRLAGIDPASVEEGLMT